MTIVLAFLYYAMWITGILILFQATWSLIRMAEAGLSDRNLRTWSHQLADSLARGDDPVDALLASQHLVRWPYPQRLRRCARLIESGTSTSLIDTLAVCKLLPKALIPLGRVAESTSPQALQRFFARLTPRVPANGAGLAGVLGPWLAAAGVMILVLTFLNLAIFPKFELILKDLGIAPPKPMEALITLTRWLSRYGIWLIPTLLVLASLAISGLLVIRWRMRQRSRLGDLLLEGLAEGQPESVLAELGTAIHPSRSNALRQCADQGDLPRLLRLSSFSASDAPSLVLTLHRRADRQDALVNMGILLVRIIAPICFGVVVGFISYAFHSCLIELLYRLAEP